MLIYVQQNTAFSATWWLHGGYTTESASMARPPKEEPIDLTQSVVLTAGLIGRLTCPSDKAQAFLRDSKAPGLRVRVTKAGAKSYVFEGKLHRETVRITIGDVRDWPLDVPDKEPPDVDSARRKARSLAVLIDQGKDPRQVTADKLAATERDKQAKKRAETFTLGALALDYAGQLERLGRTSHAKVRALLKRHIIDAAPDLAGKAAALVTGEEITDLMRKLNEDGKRRTAGKLRAYLRAAFEMARTAGMDADLPVRFKEYGIKHNPAAETKAIKNPPDKNPLSSADLRGYWRAIKDLQTFQGAVLRLHLLTGGQRLEQLCRLRTADVKAGALEFLDGKGRPGKAPRLHPVPLTAEATRALEQVKAWAPLNRKSRTQQTEKDEGTFLVSTDGGKTSVTANAMSGWARAAGKSIDNFTAKRVRSGVETALASMRVSREDRGHLLSHGVGGVQSDSYDGHDYMEVKLRALEALHRFLETAEAEVIPVSFGKAA